MKFIREKPTRIQRLLTGAFRELQKILDPRAYTHDCLKIAHAELDARHEFFVVPDINKSAAHEPDSNNNLTDEERERWFGKSRLQPDEVNWERLEDILRPSPRHGAVRRINGALQGSHNNERFSRIEHSTSSNRAGFSEPKYTPRTVSIYDTREQAMVAAKILRILTKDEHGRSIATVMADKIDNGTDTPVWIVADNMDLQTHNALRLYSTNLAHHLSPETRNNLQCASQIEVDKRLEPNERWEAWEGIPTLFTLQGRPGVKMCAKGPNSKDDPLDIERLSMLPKQELPRIVKGVPHEQVLSSDGRSYIAPGDLTANIACLLVGPKGYTFLKTGNTKLIGELIHHEADFLTKPAQARNSYEVGHHISEAITNTLGAAVDKTLALTAGAASVVLHGSAIAAGTSFYSLFKRISGTDPMKNSIKRWVEERCGPLEETKLFKVWEPRETLPAIHVQLPMENQCPGQGQDIPSLIGNITLSQSAQKASDALRQEPLKTQKIITSRRHKNPLPPTDFGHELKNFMSKKNLWPDHSQQQGNRLPDNFKDNHGFFKNRDDLAIAFGNWFHAQLQQGKQNNNLEQATQSLQKSIVAFNSCMAQGIDRLPGDHAIHIPQAINNALIAGLNQCLEQRQPTISPGQPTPRIL